MIRISDAGDAGDRYLIYGIHNTVFCFRFPGRLGALGFRRALYGRRAPGCNGAVLGRGGRQNRGGVHYGQFRILQRDIRGRVERLRLVGRRQHLFDAAQRIPGCGEVACRLQRQDERLRPLPSLIRKLLRQGGKKTQRLVPCVEAPGAECRKSLTEELLCVESHTSSYRDDTGWNSGPRKFPPPTNSTSVPEALSSLTAAESDFST